MSSDFSALFNRLVKNSKHLQKWAKRQHISCYRLYERDIPAFPLAIDRYEHRIHLQEFDTGWKISPEEYEEWVWGVRETVSAALDLPVESIYFKRRIRQRGTTQYQKLDQSGEDFIVTENGHRFIVNLEEYLDTGLFLDHRNTRKRVQLEAAGKRFLNLFSYTGSFSVYAAAGGASETVTVDLSNTYLEWARRNFELNGMKPDNHHRIRADVLAWLGQAVAQKEQFDLIVMDPPSFSNSAKMQGVLDIQRDHPWMIEQCMHLLKPAGTFYFSNNLRSFELDPAIEARFKPKNLSHQSVPDDFRNKKIHQCFQFQKPVS